MHIDVDGVTELRAHNAGVETCRDRWGSEEVQVTRDLPLLDPGERDAYDVL